MSKDRTTPPRQKTTTSQQSSRNKGNGLEVDASTEFKATAVGDHRKRYVRGTVPTPQVAVGSDQDSFAAVARRAYLYVGNVNPGASKDSIVGYIRNRAPEVDFVVDELPKREEALSRAFKLTVDFTLLEKFNKADFWPQGVVVKRFFQFKRQQQ